MATLNEQVVDLKGKIAERQAKLARAFEEAGPDFDTDKITCLSGDAAGKVEQIRALNAELTDLRKELDEKEELFRTATAAKAMQVEPPAIKAEQAQTKTIGELFVESLAFKERGKLATLDVDVKTLFQRSAGWAPESTRSDLVVDYATRPIQLSDLIPVDPWNQAAYKYMEETTFTNNAAEAAEGNAYGESALALTERSATVEKVGTWLPVTDEQLEDVAGIQSYIDRRLRFMLRQRFDYQIMNGNGESPNLVGILNKVGIQTQAKGASPANDAIHYALTKVRVTGRAFPNAVVLHPNDWQDIRLLRTTDGIYIWGNPAEAGPEMIWGVRVVQSDVIAENTGLVGDFANFSLCALRRGIDVKITNAHDDYFIKGKQAVRADFRAALVWTRPAAFCTVTGI